MEGTSSVVTTAPQARKTKRGFSDPDRLFYTITGAIFLVLTVIGFQHYIFGGKHHDGTSINPSNVAMVAVHGSSIFAWYVLFFVQSLLISTQNRRLHMRTRSFPVFKASIEASFFPVERMEVDMHAPKMPGIAGGELLDSHSPAKLAEIANGY